MTSATSESAERLCAANERCRAYDRHTGMAAVLDHPSDQLCDECLTVAERDIKVLLHDYVDLEQMLPQPITRALDTQSGFGATREAPVPLRLGVDVLQRTIWAVTTTWAEVLVDRHRLADPPYARRVNDSDPPTRVRDGFAVKWALGVIEPRVRDLARVEAVELYGYPDLDPDQAILTHGVVVAALTGAQGVLHMCWLHGRVRRMLGIARRTTRVPGRCGCNRDGNHLYRDEPRYERDPCPVYCGACAEQWTPEEYERFIGLMQAHPELADAEGMEARAGS